MDSRVVKVKDLYLGGAHPVVVQSMCTYSLLETDHIISQINELHKRGAEIVRFAVRNLKEAALIPEVIRQTEAALCADIHFNHELALRAIESGIHKVRINPGNIGSSDNVKSVVKAARSHNVPIRIGVNGGSVDRSRFSSTDPEGLVESAHEHIKILESLDFFDIVVSIKSSDVRTTVAANRLFASRFSYPLHLGVTEAGFGESALIKSSAALGALLLDGIGSTVRISMTGDPLVEVDAAEELLHHLGLNDYGLEIVSCPTCGRTHPDVDLEDLAKDVKKEFLERYGEYLKKEHRSLSVAIMGCEVNGPGEAQDADLGAAGAGKGEFIIFKGGEALKKVAQRDLIRELLFYADGVLGL